MLTQLAVSVAVHAHPAPAVTVTVALPPAAATLWFVGDAVKLHATPA
jgi:hypothetical protein